MEEKVKKKTTFWLPPDMIDRMDSWLKADNCRSRNEFVEKALRFYMGYLGTEDNTAYLSQAILTAIQGTLDDNNNRLRTILFKCAVELNKEVYETPNCRALRRKGYCKVYLSS